jgi:hypothetical protein
MQPILPAEAGTRPSPRRPGWLRALLAGLLPLASSCAGPQSTSTATSDHPPTLRVRSTEDFDLSGDGASPTWQKVDWVPLARREGGSHPYETRVKVLYSKTGLYVLFHGTDSAVTSTMDADFLDLWNEDVFEVFLWPDERDSIYFEYEISPLGHELPIIVPNLDGQFLGWLPWHYEGEKKTRKATVIHGGSRESGAAVQAWTAEVFIPYALLRPLRNVPPVPGARWRANFYRVDYDGGRSTGWHWAPVGKSFHEHSKYGTLVFE